MTGSFAAFVSLYETALWQGFVVFLRIGAMLSVMPAIGEQSVPVRIKLGLAFCFTLIVALAVPLDTVAPFSVSFEKLVLYIFTEPLAGLILGVGFRLFVHALQTAGVMMAQSLSLSQLLGGAGADPMPAIGQVLVIAGLALAVTAGLHVQVAKVMILSYEVLPLGKFPAAVDLSGWGLAQIAASFRLAFQIAAPFLLVSLLYNLTLGVINRAMPQLMVAFVGAPAITFGALALLFLLSAIILKTWVDALAVFANDPFAIAP